MIKRFNEIKNVGAFRNFSNGGSIQFEKLTFVYGLNTRGKTTLADILCSLRDDNPTLINERESIPEVTSNQAVTISIKPDETGSEETCRFNNGNWAQVSSRPNLYVFGSEFIHKNLFTGLSVQRQNKENLTQFILGQEGVELANQIAEDKRLLRQKRSAINGLVPHHIQNKSSEQIQTFLEMDPSAINLEGSQRELSKLQERLKEEQQRLHKPTEILNIQDYPELTVPENTVEELISRTRTLLVKGYSEISVEALEHIKSHIDQNFELKENAENWIKRGLDSKNNASNNCVFCGQLLSGASELIEAYHSYFNQAYRNYISDVSTEVEQLKDKWQIISFNQIGELLRNQTLLNRYQEVINSTEFNELISNFNRLADTQLEQELNGELKALSGTLLEYFNAKERKPHESVESPDFSKLTSNNLLYFNIVNELRGVVNQIRRVIQEFKDSYRDQTEIRSRMEQISTQIDILKTKIARVEQDQQCATYREALAELHTIQERISTNEETLSQNQNEYLQNFYEKIDCYFQRFGSENFSLERETNNKGHQPVYFLKVKYRGVEIDESIFKSVFSESDKRALALSIFWSKIDLLDEKQKNRSIIILDDPITSFDDNRIALSIDIMKRTLRSVRQMIILTHYSHFIRIFCEKSMNDDFTPAFIEIDQNSSSSLLKRTQQERFIETTYEKKFTKIQSFINREINEDIRQDLRPFLESQYIPHFYIDKLREAKNNGVPCGTLNQKIEAIFDDNDEAKRRFHGFRESLNPDAHIFTSANDEDVRGFARDMMGYLYSFNYI